MLPKSGNTPIESIPSFQNTLMGRYNNVAYSKMTIRAFTGYPSIYEYYDTNKAIAGIKNSQIDPENQCVAFVKMIIRDTTKTGALHPSANVMSKKYEGSDIHRGKVVAYFNNPSSFSSYSDGNGRHFGIFLGYTDNGFWIADENWGGSYKYPTGEIRKHLILTKAASTSKNGLSQSYADGYSFVDIY